MAKKDEGKYEVTIDGETERLKNKGEVKRTLDEALSDGEAHTVEVDEVPKEEKVKEEEAPAEEGAADTPAENGPPLGLRHIR